MGGGGGQGVPRALGGHGACGAGPPAGSEPAELGTGTHLSPPQSHPALLSLSQWEQRVLSTSGMSSGREQRQLLPGTAPPANLGWVTGVTRDVSLKEQPESRASVPLFAAGLTCGPVPASPGNLNPSPQPRHDPAHPQTLPGPARPSWSTSRSGRAEFPSRPSVLPALMETSLGPQPSVAERCWNGDSLSRFQVWFSSKYAELLWTGKE